MINMYNWYYGDAYDIWLQTINKFIVDNHNMINIINLINIKIYKRLWQMYGHDIKATHKWLYNIINYSIYGIIYLKLTC